MAGQALLDAHQVGMGETGNETWARNVVRQLEEEGEPLLHYAVTRAGRAALDVPKERLHTVDGSSARRLLIDLPRTLHRLSASAVLAQYTLPPTRVPGVVVVHDVSFASAQATTWIPRATLLRYRVTIGTSVRRANVVVVPTEYTRRQLTEHYRRPPEDVLVAPLAVDAAFETPVVRLRADGVLRVLCVGAVLPRKNLLVVAKAVQRLRDGGADVRLRLVGPLRPGGERDLAEMRVLLGAALEVLGPVSSAQLLQEYADADVLAYPSKHEGFGLPLLEAMSVGTPVVCSNATCLPEVAGDGALLVDPDDDLAWETALRMAWENPKDLTDRGRARVAQFSWAHTTSVLRQALERAAG